MTPAEVLRAAREKIATPERWTQGACARTPRGHPLSPESPLARAWDAIGAAVAVSDTWWSTDVAWGFLNVASEERGVLASNKDSAIVVFNDAPERTHADILAIFDRAIALAEAP